LSFTIQHLTLVCDGILFIAFIFLVFRLSIFTPHALRS